MDENLKSDFNFTFPKQDAALKKVLTRSRKIALQPGPVLIEGETGTGKSVLARYIHSLSQRNGNPPIIFGCGELHSGTIESALFGHTRGAFTGALSDKDGILSASSGSTLILDDIDCLPVKQQHSLLRFLDDGAVHKLGEANKSTNVDTRIICTTNKNIKAFIEEKRFLPDLFFRLRKWALKVPPLRSREESIVHFASVFLEDFQGENNDGDIADDNQWFFGKETLDLFKELPWPGNLRQLKHAVDNIALFTDGDKRPISLQDSIDILFDEDMPVLYSHVTKKNSDNNKLYKILIATSWNIKMTHRITGLSRTTIYKRIKENKWDLPNIVSKM